MTTTDEHDLSAGARDHLWMHFTRLSAYTGARRPRCR